MKFSLKKKSKLRKIRFERNKRQWGGIQYREVYGDKVIDNMSIGQTLYLLTEGKYFYNIIRVGGGEELTVMSPKRILGKKGAFQKASKWYHKSKLTIDDRGEITNVESTQTTAKENTIGVIIVPLY